MSSTLGDSSALNADQDHTDFATKNASDFYSALQNMLRQLCYTYLHFDECVEVVGLICVEIDHKSKDNHSIKEVVRRGLAPKERTHERRQSDLEASEAELVTLAMSRVAQKDRCADGHDDAKAEGQAVASDDAGTTLPNSVSVSDVDSAVSASLQCARTLDHEGRTSWDGGGEQSEAAAPVCSDKSEVAEGSIEDPTGGEGSAPCSVTVLPTSDIHSKSQHNYDETDHAAIVAGSHHTDSNTSVETSGKNSTHALPSSWLTHSHGQHGACLPNGSPSHGIEHCTSCAAGELHNKVVVSGDGTVSHVVHNGPMSRQVYRIDLSNHEHSCDMEVNLGLQSSLAQPKDHMGEQSRDRAASIESTDSFMEVGILSQINHAQRLLASPSPTDQSKASPVPSPVVSLVADSSLRAAFDAFPAPPPDTALASESLDVPCSPVPFEASSHPNHTSVIKQLNHSEKPASHKTDPSASFREASFPSEERNVSPARVSGNEGDLPLDMSVVKEEEDSAEQSAQDRQSVKQGLAHPDEQSSSHDAEDASSSSLSPPCSMPSEATTTAAVGDASHLLSSSSSMEHLQRYTDRLLQQRHITTDLSLLHSSFFSSVDMDDATRSRKRKLSELDDGELAKGSPWPRKDMTQKEEYQFLERDPFMDFAEMTRLFPNMQQRTFYRWKRRIKDQFMFLEQQPTMTYAQFSQYFPQVREHVFQHWLDLLTHGHRFLGDSGKLGTSFGDSSSLSSALLKTAGGEGGSGDSVKDGDGGATSDSFVSQYIFLQKNPSLEVEQFTKVFPEVPRHMFYMWKKQIFSDFLKLQANPKMTYQEFRKQASVTQDVYSLWKAHLMLMTNSSHFISTCNSLVSASSTLAAAAPTLPPVSLLASQTGSKSINPDLAAWYASYAPLMGQVALPFWSPLSIMSNPSLTATFSSLRDGSGVDQDTDKDQSMEKASVSDRFTDSDGNRRVESESSSTIETGLSNVSDKVGDDEGSPSPQVAEAGGNGQGTITHRGRRQSLKPEHYFYLLNPDTPYLALTRIFPGVSAQRYGRWRRKVSSALAFLEREPNCSDGRFELYFPNVPDEILSSWRERVQQGHSRLIMGVQDSSDEPSVQTLAPTQPPASVHPQLTSPSPAPSGCQSRDSSVGADAISMEEGVARNGDSDKLHEDRLRELAHESPAGPSPRKQYKSSREEYLFVQRYPSVDFSTFTTYYPNISVRTFYRWRRQVRDAINMLRSKPTLSLQGFQEQFPVLRERFPELTEEMFASWQRLVKEESQQEAEGSSAAQVRGEEAADSLLVLSQQQQLQPHAESVAEEREPAIQQCVADGQRGSGVAHDDSHDPSEDSRQSHSDLAGGRSPCRQEQLLVHMNPFLDYAEMNRTFPSVTQRTFFRWKAEVRHVMEYMRKHPDVSYDDIASAVPGVSFQAFSMWQQMIQAEKIQPHLERKMDSDPGSRYGSHGTEQHDGTDSSRLNSQTVSDGGSVDGSSQDRSSIALRPSVESAEESFSLMGGEGDEIYAAKARRQTRDEFIEVMLNPAMDYAEFARRFGTVSQRTFYRWRAHIRDWRAAIRADPQLDYATFSRHARDVPEYVFKVWRDWESCMDSSRSHSTGEDSERAQSELSQSSGGHAQSAASTASQGGGSGSSEVGKSRNSKQLELMWMAYDYYQSHPTIDFKGLSALFPSVSMDMFQQWKKGVDVRMEYIRNIPSTNFEDFNRLFPDVKENIFNILKANVLSEKSGGETYYLSHSQSVPDTATSCLPVMQSAYSSSSEASFAQAANTRTSDKQDGISDSTVLHAAEGESTHQGVYSGTTPVPTQSSHLQSSHSAGSKEGLSVITPTAVSIKQETSPNTPLPSFTETVSNLSNLSRLNAMFQNRLPQTTPVASTANAPPVPLYPHTTVVTTTSTAISSNFSTALAGIVGNTLRKAMAASSTSASPTPMYPTTSHLYPSISPSAPSEPPSGSLYHVEEGEASGPQDIQASVGFEEAQAGLEERGLDTSGLDTSGHSSQRQRKLQREEYMFVEQNPDVDVQEFLARFPKVSLRTFYRWKREIREEQQARGIIGGMG